MGSNMAHKHTSYEDVLLNWIFLERSINGMVLREFRLESNDYVSPQAKVIVDVLSFQQKFNFLNELNLLTKKENAAIKDFQEARNRLFHDNTKMDIIKTFVEKDKQERLISIAVSAFEAVCNAEDRQISAKAPTPTCTRYIGERLLGDRAGTKCKVCNKGTLRMVNHKLNSVEYVCDNCGAKHADVRGNMSLGSNAETSTRP